MATRTPAPIPPNEIRERRSRILQLARSLGFIGRVEYRHVIGQAGGAQYGRGAVSDMLIVDAVAFERDADPEDFSLTAMIAHERGHQLVARHPRLAPLLAGASPPAEEVLASVLGALVLEPGVDRDALIHKAFFDILSGGAAAETAAGVVQRLWDQLGELL